MSERNDLLAAYELAGTLTPIVLAEVNGHQFLVPTRDETIGRSIYVKHSRPEQAGLAKTVAILRKEGLLAATGGTFVDVGANIGTATVFALDDHGFSRAVACEPHPASFRLLRLNLVLNDLEWRVRALPVALSNKRGAAELATHDTNSGGHVLLTAGAAPLEGPDAPGGARVLVERTTLDYLADHGVLDANDVGLLWLDVQGHEGHVLRGASTLLRQGTPVVLEFHPELLRASGGLDLVDEIATRWYSHYVDLREVELIPELAYAPHPTSKLAAMADRLGERRFTDVLLVRRGG